MAEQVVSRLEFQPGTDRDERTARIAAERARLRQAQPGVRLAERVVVGPQGKNVVEWYREDQ